MPSTDAAILSSLASSLDDLTKRVTAVGDSFAARKHEGPASDLFEIERTLRTASRRLERLLTDLT